VRQKRLKPDKRAIRSRTAVVAAFNRLMFEEGYDSLSVSAIATAANVSRSTFYQHFRNCDAVLSQSIGQLFERLACACLRATDDGEVARLCQHFWDGRRLARAILAGRQGELMAALLTDKLYAALKARPGRRRPAREEWLVKSVCVHFSWGSIGLLSAWLTGRLPATVQQVASVLRSVAHVVFAAEAPLGFTVSVNR